MLGKTHIVNSLAIASTPLLITQFNERYALLTCLFVLGCITPDIDEPKSIIGRNFKLISKTINYFFGHRTITHNIPLILITIFLSFYFDKILLVVFFTGCLVHIMQDSLTWGGIEYGLFPFRYRKYHLLRYGLRFKVGSKTESIIYYMSALYIVSILLYVQPF
ncbi:MAG: inner membrane protein [Candidatus Tokpelaia sp. JSC188]|nr:MAG: inner membrane protein [Candidatus Tokpelaia sp. JSC188]